MGKKILDSKLLYIFLSVIIAVSLWFYVTSLDGNEDSKKISGIPVTFTGVDILEERGLMIVGTTPTVSVEVKAAPVVLAKLNDKTMRATVNVSQITEASEYTLAYTVSLPAGISQSQVSFVSGHTGNVRFNVVRFSSREVPIRGQFIGTAAEGYLPGDVDEFIFAPGKLTISGQSDLVNQVAYVLVTVDGENLEDNVSGSYPYQLIGVYGQPLEDLDLTCSEETIYVTYPIWATTEIKLDLKFTPGGGVNEHTMNYTMSTDRITVAGTKDAVAGISGGSITLANINLAAVHDGDELRYTIPLADELTNLSGITEVVVTMHLDKSLVTDTVEVTDIDWINLPEGWSASLVTQVLPVTVRGASQWMELLTPESLRVVADLKDVNLAEGQYTVPVRIYLDSVGTAGEIGVVGTDYKVVVSITKR